MGCCTHGTADRHNIFSYYIKYNLFLEQIRQKIIIYHQINTPGHFQVIWYFVEDSKRVDKQISKFPPVIFNKNQLTLNFCQPNVSLIEAKNFKNYQNKT